LPDRGANPGRSGRKPAINCFSYGAAHRTIYLKSPVTLPTHPKQQQPEHKFKEQTSQKQKKAPTAMTTMTGCPGKKSVEETSRYSD
jgi:hypothetical protein